ncbi:hypothetical protein [Geopseudomonas aromaticivorans]
MTNAPQNTFEQTQMKLVAETTRDALALHAASSSPSALQEQIQAVSIKMQSADYRRVFTQQIAATETRLQERDPGNGFSAQSLLEEIDLAGIENRKGWAAEGAGYSAALLDADALARLKGTRLEGRAIEVMAESITDTGYSKTFVSRGAAIESYQSYFPASPRHFNTQDALAAIEAQSNIQLMMRSSESLSADPEAIAPVPPEPALGERLLKGAGDIFNRFTTAVAGADITIAAGLPMTAAGVLMLTGMGMEAHEMQTLVDQGGMAYAKHMAHLAEVNPKDMTDYIVAAFKGELAGAGANEAKVGEVLAFATPVVAAAAILAAKGFNHLREWMGKQPFDAEAVHERAMNASNDPARGPDPRSPS